MKCGGHVGRAHGNTLKDSKSKSSPMTTRKGMKTPFQLNIWSVAIVKKKRHSKGCGYISDGFIESAKWNLFCAI